MAWLWLWTDILDCAKLAELDDSMFRGWIMLLACAKRYEANGSLPRLKELAYWCRTPEQTVKTWLLVLKDHELLDRDGETFSIHDWEQWQPRNPGPRQTGKAISNTERQRAWRERHRSERNVTRNAPLDPPKENNRIEDRRVRTPLRNENSNVTNSVTRYVTEFPPPDEYISPILTQGSSEDQRNERNERNDNSVTAVTPHLCKSFNIECKQCKVDHCIKEAGEKWGASNGEAVINDLLRTFPPEIVDEAMDACWNKFQNELKPAYLRKCCEGKFRDHANKNGKPQ